MIKNGIMVEPFGQMGRETEFFLQTTPQNTNACGAHIHGAAELLYVRQGSYTATLDGTPYEIHEGDLILFCSGAIHYVVAGSCPQNSYYVIKIPPSFFIDLARSDAGAEYAMRFALNREENKCFWSKDELEKSEIKQVLDALISEHTRQRYASPVAIKLKVMELMLTILRYEVPGKSATNDQISLIIYSAMNYVQERFAEDVDENELAKEFGISYSYFSRSFKRVTGMTFRNYLNRTRIKKAEQLLFLDGRSISEAAITCGYNSVSYFIKVYRSITGKTPYQTLKAK